MVKPKKHLGQHFLKDQNIARKIVNALNPGVSQNLLEIGPGTGVLSKLILEMNAFNFRMIEIDPESVKYLKENFEIKHDQIIEGDFLNISLEEIFSGPFHVIGNFPYNISSQIFFKVLEYKNHIPQVVGMIQKEVAERIVSPPGNKTYGILSVLLQVYYDIDYLFTVPEHVFVPPPKVKSAVVRLTRNQRQQLECNEKELFTLVKTAFNQRRKTLRNSLKIYINSKIRDYDIFDQRPEQLSVNDFIQLTQLLFDRNKILFS